MLRTRISPAELRRLAASHIQKSLPKGARAGIGIPVFERDQASGTLVFQGMEVEIIDPPNHERSAELRLAR